MSSIEAVTAQSGTTNLGSVLFAEFGLRYDTDVGYTGTTCQMSLYTPNSQTGTLHFNAIHEKDKTLIENNEAVLDDQGLEAFPASVRGKQSGRVTTRTNLRLDSTTDFQVERPITLPNARLSVDGTNVVLRCQGDSLRVGSEESGELTLAQTEARPEHIAGEMKMFPVLEVNNYGRLDVTATNIIEGDTA